jgi:hypothetical protein
MNMSTEQDLDLQPEPNAEQAWMEFLDVIDRDPEAKPAGSDFLAVDSDEETIPENHGSVTTLAKNPLALGGIVFAALSLLILGGTGLYGALAGKSSSEKMAEVVPAANAFPRERTTNDNPDKDVELMQRKRNDRLQPNPPVPTVKTPSLNNRVTPQRQIVVQRVPVIQRVASSAPQSAPARYQPSMLPRAQVARASEPIDPEKAWQESGETLYAPASGEGPEVAADEPVARQVPDLASPQSVANQKVASTANSSSIDQALALYDGTGGATSSQSIAPSRIASMPVEPAGVPTPQPTQPREIAQSPMPTPTPQPTPTPTPQSLSPVEEVAMKDNPIPTPIEEQKLIPSGAVIKAKMRDAIAWNANGQPQTSQISLVIQDPVKDKTGVTLIPRGAVASASITSVLGQGMLQAEVNSIDIPGRSPIALSAGQLRVETGDGFLQADLKSGKKGGVGRTIGNIASRLAGGVIYSAASRYVPRGRDIEDVAVQSVSNEGVNAIENAIAPSSNNRYSPSAGVWMLKPNRRVDLVAQADIQF